MNECLKEEQIIKVIREYIQNKNTDYAVLLDGNWGSGKTFFIENSIINRFKGQKVEKDNKKKKIKFIYISVYGIKEIKEIDNKIYDSIIEDFFPKEFRKFHRIFNKGVKSIYKLAGAFKQLPNIPKDSVRNLIEILQNQKKYIMVFDDIERCEIPISELLGYINDFVEHKKIKTILISNEKEILKKCLYTNAELKYLVAENKSLDIPKEKDSFESIFEIKSRNKDDSNIKFNVQDINNRVEKIFGEDTLYKQIKEKLIGITIYYEPDLEKITEEIIKEYVSDDKVKKYIQSNKRIIINIMNNKGHVNIRTLKIAINIIEKVLSVVFKLDLSKYEEKDIENCKKEIIRYTMASCIKYKNGEWKYDNNSEFFSINDQISIYNNYSGFKFINEIIEKNYIDDSKIADAIKLYIQSIAENTNEADDPINNLKYYWEMNDRDIENNYKRLKEKLIKDMYKSISYPIILYTVFRLTRIGFPNEYVDDIRDIILDKINTKKEIEEYNEYQELDFIFNDSEEKENFNEIIKPIKNLMDKSNNSNRKENINNIITKEEGWGKSFLEYCLERRGGFKARKEFFQLIDIDNLIQCIEKSSTKDISDFRRTVYGIYDSNNIKQFYENDILKLKEFKKEIEIMKKSENFNNYDKSKKFNIDLLNKNIEDIIGKLES